VLTSLGRKALTASLALYGAAFGLGYPDLAVPAVAGVLTIGTAALSVARRPRVRLTVSVTPAQVSRGEQVTANIALRNDAGSRSPRFAITLPHGSGLTRLTVKSLAADEHRQIPVTLGCARRGLLEIGPPAVRQGDVFGLCHRTQVAGRPVTVPVYPVVHPVPLPSVPRPRQLEGVASARAPDGGVVFHSLREYVPGDDLRQVHWLASARSASTSGSLLVRRQVNLSDAPSSVLLDTCARSYLGMPDAADGLFEAAVDLAASVLVASARTGFQIRLHTTSGVTVRAGRGRDNELRALDALARIQAGDQESVGLLNTAVSHLRASGARSATLTLITGAGREIPGSLARALCRDHERVIIARIGWAAGDPGASPAELPGTRHRMQVFQAATAAEAARKWAAIVTRGWAQPW
jgi:uncharacterized protein (DUF58 family)